MAIPDYETVMLPLLRYVASRNEAHIRDITDQMAKEFALSDAERAALIPSGKTPVIRSRAGWARSYLVQAGVLEAVRRGVVRATDRGRQILHQNPTKIDNSMLMQFTQFRDFRSRTRELQQTGQTDIDTPAILDSMSPITPDDQITNAVASIEARVRSDLLQKILESSPEFFERVVVDLLLSMGYGSSAEDAGETLGKSGDGGIDGIIREDRLGLDLIYIQAKRYRDQSINADHVRSFSGALNDKGARKGVFITTSRFTADAEKFAQRQQNQRIVLIDGAQLTLLMLRHDVGVRPDRTLVLKRIDVDYFDPDGEG